VPVFDPAVYQPLSPVDIVVCIVLVVLEAGDQFAKNRTLNLKTMHSFATCGSCVGGACFCNGTGDAEVTAAGAGYRFPNAMCVGPP
jgi:hypothetical protein